MKTIEIKTVEINKEIVTEVHCDRCGALLFEEGACDAEGKPNPGAIPVHCHIVSTDHVDLDFSPTGLGSSDVSKNKHIYESCDDCISDMVKEIMDGTFVSIYDETGTLVGKARTRMLNTRGQIQLHPKSFLIASRSPGNMLSPGFTRFVTTYIL